MDLGIPHQKGAESEVEQSKCDLGLRRIDQNHLSAALHQYVKGIYTKFLGLLDHKCVILTLTGSEHSFGGRWKCPVDFLEDEAVCQTLQQDLSSLPSDGHWWSRARHCVARTAHQYVFFHSGVGVAEVASYVQASSLDYVCLQGRKLLSQYGYTLTNPADQYHMLVSRRQHRAVIK